MTKLSGTRRLTVLVVATVLSALVAMLAYLGGTPGGVSAQVGGPVTTVPDTSGFAAARFSGVAPSRLLDTRAEEAAPGPKGFVAAGSEIEFQITGTPSTVAAVVLNVTATQTAAAGFLTIYPSGQSRPSASNLNVAAPGQTASNLVIARPGVEGKVRLFSSGGAHVVVDLMGYFFRSGATSQGRLVALSPSRLFDTRASEAAPGPKGFVPPGTAITVNALGVAGLPASNVAAVVINLTATEATAAGFVTIWSGGARPTASVLNLNGPGDTAANLVIVSLTGATLQVFTSGGAHLLADVVGYFVSDGPASTSGLFVPVPLDRVFDTRPGEPAPGPKGILAPGTSIDVAMTGVGGIAPTGVAAVAFNLTGTSATAPGFITIYPAGSPRPLSSNLNLNLVGDTRANSVIMPVGTAGRLSAFSQSGAHLLGDAVGFFLS